MHDFLITSSVTESSLTNTIPLKVKQVSFHLTKPLIFIYRTGRNLYVLEYDSGIKLRATLQHLTCFGCTTSVQPCLFSVLES